MKKLSVAIFTECVNTFKELVANEEDYEQYNQEAISVNHLSHMINYFYQVGQ